MEPPNRTKHYTGSGNKTRMATHAKAAFLPFHPWKIKNLELLHPVRTEQSSQVNASNEARVVSIRQDHVASTVLSLEFPDPTLLRN